MQRENNPDVNTYQPDSSPGDEQNQSDPREPGVQSPKDRDVIPVPPDAAPGAVPIEEPPDPGSAPVGDVDDSPKQIA